MHAAEPRRSIEELERLATDIFDRRIRSTLRADDDGKFIAIDVVTNDYELDADDYTAVMRLKTRNATAEVWLMRAGRRATCELRTPRFLRNEEPR